MLQATISCWCINDGAGRVHFAWQVSLYWSLKSGLFLYCGVNNYFSLLYFCYRSALSLSINCYIIILNINYISKFFCIIWQNIEKQRKQTNIQKKPQYSLLMKSITQVQSMNDTTIHTGFILLGGSVWNSISNLFFVHSGCLKINGRLVIFIIHRFWCKASCTPVYAKERSLSLSKRLSVMSSIRVF